mgnify:CR=1 FL=1
MKESNIIIKAIANFIRNIRTTSRAKYIDELQENYNFIIDINTLKTYEEQKALLYYWYIIETFSSF